MTTKISDYIENTVIPKLSNPGYSLLHIKRYGCSGTVCPGVHTEDNANLFFSLFQDEIFEILDILEEQHWGHHIKMGFERKKRGGGIRKVLAQTAYEFVIQELITRYQIGKHYRELLDWEKDVDRKLQELEDES